MATKNVEQKEIKSIVIDGVEYVTKNQVCAMTGYTRPGLDNKLKSTSLTCLVRGNRRTLLRLSDVQEAIKDGRLVKYM